MYPLINVLGREISVYGIVSLIGIMVAGLAMCRFAKRRGHDDTDFIIFMLICAIGVFFGGHIVYGFTQIQPLVLWFSNWSKYTPTFMDFLKNVAYCFGGSVFYGGLLGGMAAGLIYGKAKKLDILEYADICAPIVPLFHCFGRIGCFFGGCCYGIESSFGFTVHNNTLNPPINDVQRFPVQLLEAAINLALFFVLAYMLKNGKLKGRLFPTYLVIYAVVRFFDEFLRGDTYRGFLFGLSTSQIISIIVFAGAVIYLIAVRDRGTKKPANQLQ